MDAPKSGDNYNICELRTLIEVIVDNRNCSPIKASFNYEARILI